MDAGVSALLAAIVAVCGGIFGVYRVWNIVFTKPRFDLESRVNEKVDALGVIIERQQREIDVCQKELIRHQAEIEELRRNGESTQRKLDRILDILMQRDK